MLFYNKEELSPKPLKTTTADQATVLKRNKNNNSRPSNCAKTQQNTTTADQATVLKRNKKQQQHSNTLT